MRRLLKSCARSPRPSGWVAYFDSTLRRSLARSPRSITSAISCGLRAFVHARRRIGALFASTIHPAVIEKAVRLRRTTRHEDASGPDRVSKVWRRLRASTAHVLLARYLLSWPSLPAMQRTLR